jgi:hypothetical protein
MKSTKNNKSISVIAPMLAAALLAAGLLLALQATKPTPVYAHEVPTPCDFTTGGGFIFVSQGTSSSPLTETGQKANFGLVGGCKNGGFFGHVNYVDHNNGLHVSSDTITAYVNPCPGCIPPAANNARDICGTADVSINGTPIMGPWGFRVRTIDAEQQSSPPPKDKFGIHIHSLDSSGNAGSTAYLVQTRCLASDGSTGNVMTCSAVNPGGGDIELHKPNPSTTGPSLTETQISNACGPDDLGY